MRQDVELRHATRLLNHGPTVLVGSASQGRRNLMAAAWSMPVEFSPPRIAIVLDKSTFTREQIVRSAMFSLSLPCRAQADLTFTVGSVSALAADAHTPDKLQRFAISAFAGPVLGVPLVDGCVAWLECRLLEAGHVQESFDTFFGEVVSAQADPRVFAQGRWSFREDNRDLHTLHHLGGGRFAVPAGEIQGQMLDG